MLWRLASAWGDSPAKNSWTTCRLNSIECMRCLAMGFLLESPGQLADSQVPYLSTPRGALQSSETSCPTRALGVVGGKREPLRAGHAQVTGSPSRIRPANGDHRSIA